MIEIMGGNQTSFDIKVFFKDLLADNKLNVFCVIINMRGLGLNKIICFFIDSFIIRCLKPANLNFLKNCFKIIDYLILILKVCGFSNLLQSILFFRSSHFQ